MVLKTSLLCTLVFIPPCSKTSILVSPSCVDVQQISPHSSCGASRKSAERAHKSRERLRDSLETETLPRALFIVWKVFRLRGLCARYQRNPSSLKRSLGDDFFFSSLAVSDSLPHDQQCGNGALKLAVLCVKDVARWRMPINTTQTLLLHLTLVCSQRKMIQHSYRGGGAGFWFYDHCRWHH